MPVSEASLSGWLAVTLESDRLRVTVLPEKGADIVELLDKESGVDPLLRTPWGLAPPGAPPREGSGGTEFVWNYEAGDSFALKTHICHIRTKLNLIKGQPGYIISVPQIGYMLETS